MVRPHLPLHQARAADNGADNFISNARINTIGGDHDDGAHSLSP
jgi:hypothetical protein